jgi:hypothetical protein
MKRRPNARPAPSQAMLDAATVQRLRDALLVAADLLDPPGKQRRARKQAGKNARPEAGR